MKVKLEVTFGDVVVKVRRAETLDELLKSNGLGYIRERKDVTLHSWMSLIEFKKQWKKVVDVDIALISVDFVEGKTLTDGYFHVEVLSITNPNSFFIPEGQVLAEELFGFLGVKTS